MIERAVCIQKIVSGKWHFPAILLLAWLALTGVVAKAEDFLEPQVAFQFSARMADPKTVEVAYRIAEGYYMYREPFAFLAEGAVLGKAVLPAGKIKFDETFNKDVETYRHLIVIRMPVDAAGPFTLKATSQGCADKGLCYAPMESTARLDPGTAALSAAPPLVSSTVDQGSSVVDGQDNSETGRLGRYLKEGNLLMIVPVFMLLGLGLAFTPCVLPLVPILSFIIVGEGQGVSRMRAFLLSLSYSLGMAVVYTALGIAAGLIGEGLSAQLQNPWILSAFALITAIFSLAMFGVFQLQMPAWIQSRLVTASEKQSKGKFAGVFLMGAISALIVGPCVAAPLAASLVYISQTRDVLIGGSALFSMAVGMSIPLLLVGLSAGTLLPRAGAWMETVKRFFGVLMLALSLWMISPLISVQWQMAGWALLGMAYGGFLLMSKRSGYLARIVGLVFFALGMLQAIGAAIGARDVLAPISHLRGEKSRHVEFARVRSVAELDAALANSGGRYVMLDFYADWCVSCKEMERFTFSDPRVQQQLGKILLLQADVTANSEDDKALLKRFGLFGPPGIIFFNAEGNEVPGSRVIGYQKTEKFLASLAATGIAD
ncbi:MAG: protein-disulfide reductase [Paucimonas sp.]|nr:protein-disulfide reductase [Paucimonas sp.]